MPATLWISLLWVTCLAHASFCSVPKTRVLDRHGVRLEQLEEEMFIGDRNITHLILSNCSITSIHHRAFCGLQQLRVLDLSNNDIQNLDPETFMCTPRLRMLYLPNNEHIGATTRGMFLRSKSIIHLDIKNCGFDSFSRDTFTAMRNLKTVVASDNPACQSLSHNTWSVRKLQCGERFIHITPPETQPKKEFSYPDDVVELKMLNFTSTVIPERFLENQNLSHIQSLQMSGLNLITIHHSAFCGLNSLRSLDLSNNDLQFIDPFTFYCLPNLENLTLANNPRLGFGPHRTFLYSHSIRNLNVSNCGFTSYGEGMLSFVKGLRSVDASTNAICSRMAEDLNHIEQVHCSGNDASHPWITVENLSEDFFADMKWRNVVSLDLSNRSISNIHRTTFCSFRYLRELDLSENQLVFLDSEMFDCTPALENLYLMSNRMLQPDPNSIFLYSTTIKYVDIENCSFTSFTDFMFSGMESLVFINAAGNPSCSQTTLNLRDISNVPCTDVFDPKVNAYEIPDRREGQVRSAALLQDASSRLSDYSEEMMSQEEPSVQSGSRGGIMSQLLLISVAINTVLVMCILVTFLCFLKLKGNNADGMKERLLP